MNLDYFFKGAPEGTPSTEFSNTVFKLKQGESERIVFTENYFFYTFILNLFDKVYFVLKQL